MGILLIVWALSGCNGGAAGLERPAAGTEFQAQWIADPAFPGQQARLVAELQHGAGAGGTVAVAIYARDVKALRTAYFRLSYDERRFSPVAVRSGPLLREHANGDGLLELYKLDIPGYIEGGQVLPHCMDAPGVYGPGLLALAYFRQRPCMLVAKSACQPPDNSASKTVLDFNGSNILQWRFCSQGDYNQNGQVWVTDLTPLGVHYGMSVAYPAERDTARAVVDGNGDGTVTIADLTPVGVNYGKNMQQGWRVYASSSVADYPMLWNNGNGGARLLGNVGVAGYDAITNPATDRVLYMWTIAAPVAGDIYWVRPVDSAGTEGIASTYAPAGNNSPFALFTTHAGNGTGLAGIPPHCVYFDATSSYDPDGNPIVSYAWDFENDGVVDDTTATPMHVFYSEGTWRVVLTVSDGTLTGSYYCDLVVGPAGTWNTVTLDALDDAGRCCSLASINGCPAVAYVQQTGINPLLCYIESSSPHGESGTWSVPVTLVAGDIRWISLAQINGQPAIAFYQVDAATPTLAYCFRTGSGWSGGLPVDTDIDAGNYCNLITYDNIPRIVYYRRDGTGDGMLRMLTAGNSGGTSWPIPPYLLDGIITNDVGMYASALVRPGAIDVAYYDALFQVLMFIHPNDPLLSGWTKHVVDGRAGWDCGKEAKLVIIDEHPVIAYLASIAGPPPQTQLLLARANDAMGADWSNTPDTVSSSWLGGAFSLEVIDGQPAFAFEETTTHTLAYARSSEYAHYIFPEYCAIVSNPAEDYSQYIDMQDIGGHPAIAFYEAVNQELRFAMRY